MNFIKFIFTKVFLKQIGIDIDELVAEAAKKQLEHVTSEQETLQLCNTESKDSTDYLTFQQISKRTWIIH